MENKSIKRVMSTKNLAYCALLAALSVVLARLIIPMPDESTRFSIEAVPIYMAGMLFGPLAGGLVGFSADFVGCMFSGYGFNPLFSLPPILYGVFGGVFRRFLARKISVPRLILGFLPPIVLGSVLYQSFALAYVYYRNTFMEGLILKFTARSIQFAITMIIDAVVIYLLFKARIFDRLGIWPPKPKRKTFNQKGNHNNDC